MGLAMQCEEALPAELHTLQNKNETHVLRAESVIRFAIMSVEISSLGIVVQENKQKSRVERFHFTRLMKSRWTDAEPAGSTLRPVSSAHMRDEMYPEALPGVSSRHHKEHAIF